MSVLKQHRDKLPMASNSLAKLNKYYNLPNKKSTKRATKNISHIKNFVNIE